ncbi:hypothetical protein ROT00_12400 [Agromyces mediolanus]|uniref:hypothetical protein n=1 Tax=Agromyces mediolanus TaxID=41986 RepID=UPI0038348E3B
MRDTLHHSPDARLSTLPGATIIRRIRRLLLWGLGTALVYAGLSAASKGLCRGGVSGDGGFVDGDGQTSSAVPLCVNLVLRPSPIVYVAIAAIVLIALTLVLRRAVDEASALRTLDRAVILIVAVTAAWLALTLVSFMSIPLDSWDGGEQFWIPFTFGNVDIDVSPMQTSG